MDFKVTGAITHISEVVKGQKKDGSGEWQKLSFTIKTPDEYNNLYAFDVFGDEKVENLKHRTNTTTFMLLMYLETKK